MWNTGVVMNELSFNKLLKIVENRYTSNEEKLLKEINLLYEQKFESLSEYYEYFDKLTTKFELGIDTENVNRLNIVDFKVNEYDNNKFLIFIQKDRTLLNYEIDNNYNMNLKYPEEYYKLNIAINDGILFTYSYSSSFDKIKKDYEYLIKLLDNNIDKLIDILINKVID